MRHHFVGHKFSGMRSVFYFICHFICLMGVSLPAFAGEYAVLTNGLLLHADRHETDGSIVRLHDGDGVTELPASSIAAFQPDGAETPKPAAAANTQPVAVPATPPVPKTPEQLAADAAHKYSLPEPFVKSVMRAESNFKTNAVSPKGATGLMQLMPQTARELGVDATDPAQNADGGARYLRDLLARYEGDPLQVMLALAAYNAGPEAVEKYRGIPPYRETREYILRVLKDWDGSGNK
jgi:hypothetical protein